MAALPLLFSQRLQAANHQGVEAAFRVRLRLITFAGGQAREQLDALVHRPHRVDVEAPGFHRRNDIPT